MVIASTSVATQLRAHVHSHINTQNDCTPVHVCGGYYITFRRLNHIDLSTLQSAFARDNT